MPSTLLSLSQIKKSQTTKTKSKIQDKEEDEKQEDKKKQVSPIYPWDHVQRSAWEAEEQPHKLLHLQEAPTWRNNESFGS